MNIFGFRPFKGKFNLGNSDDIPTNNDGTLIGAIKQINTHLTASNDAPFRFGYDSDTDKYGYIVDEGGADTFRPFSSGGVKIKSIQSGVVGPSSSNVGSYTISFNAVDPEKSIIITGCQCSSNNPGASCGGIITSATTASLKSWCAYSGIYIRWQVIEFEGNIRVQKGTTANQSSQPQTFTITVSEINTAKSFLIVQPFPATQITTVGGLINTSKQIYVYLSAPATTNQATWQLVEFLD